jgi:hypothetical protein
MAQSPHVRARLNIAMDGARVSLLGYGMTVPLVVFFWGE